MRPAGIMRQAVHKTAAELARERASALVPGATWREITARLVGQGYGQRAVRDTIKNMARYGHLRPVGEVRVSGSNRPLLAYAPAQPMERGAAPGVALAGVMRSWSAVR